MSKPRIAFLGLGIMGSGMAGRLLANAFPVTVFNRSRERAAPFAGEGAEVAASARAAAAHADVVVSMVADDEASRAVWLGEGGALEGIRRGAVVIESSTLTVGWIHELSGAAEARGCEFLDAPVTGSKAQAAAGQLNFLVGGSAETLERVRPVLAAMSRSITLLGPTGSGALVKLVNNFVCGVEVAALAEAIAVLQRSGLEWARALEVLTDGAPGSPLMKMVAARMTSGDYTPQFQLRLMLKDLGYAIREAGDLSVQLETAAAAAGLYRKGIVAGYGDEDMAALAKVVRPRDGGD
jgi:3-hydroxyisobutyrate dehydrogenase